MTEHFNLSLYRLPEDVVLLLDNINTAEQLIEDAHRLMPDSFTIYFKDVDRKCEIATSLRVRVVDACPERLLRGATVIQWKDPFHVKDDWQQIPLEDVRHIQGHWYK